MSRIVFLQCQVICFRTSLQQSMLISTRATIKKVRNPEDPHRYYKWGYKPLPVQTSLDPQIPEFSIRSPKFKLPSLNKGRLTRRKLREKIVEMQQARIGANLEKLARNRQLLVSLEEIEKEWKKDYGLIEIHKLAKFYGINRDLFQGKDIALETILDVVFNNTKVHRGNFLEVSDVLCAPTKVSFTTNESSLYSIILSNLDGHPLDTTKELVHWAVCNIKGGDLSSGDIIYEYLPPMPWKGTGYHRLVFSLYKHCSVVPPLKVHNQNTLASRTFSTPDFLSSNTHLIPVALSWFQLQWDNSVSELVKKLSDLNEEPIFDWNEYIEPKEENRLLLLQLSELNHIIMSRLIKSTSSECRVYVGNLPQFVKNRDIEDLFDKYGPIKAIDIHNRFDPAFAFLEFEDPRDASDAVYGKDGERFEGQRIRVQFPRNSAAGRERSEPGSSSNGGGGYVRGRGRGPPIRRSENRVLVSGLPPTGSWQDLKDHMREAGEVLYADVYKDGTAVCEFANYEDMKWAVKYLDDSKFKSHENETTFVRVKRDGNSRSRSPGARRSRSRSLRRSGSHSPRRRTRSPSPRPVNSRSRSRSRSPRRFSRSRSPIRRRSRSRSDSRR